MILKFIIWSIVLTLILRFVMRVVLPIFTMTRMAQDKMAQMQKQMQDMYEQQNRQQHPTPKASKQVDGDYIDYEEIK